MFFPGVYICTGLELSLLQIGFQLGAGSAGFFQCLAVIQLGIGEGAQGAAYQRGIPGQRLPHAFGDGLRVVLLGKRSVLADAAQNCGGDHRVGQKQRRQRAGKRVQRRLRQCVKPAENQRLEEIDHHQPQQSEGNQRVGADAAVQIELALAVVPPAGMEQLLHDIGGHIFQRTADQHGQ